MEKHFTSGMVLDTLSKYDILLVNIYLIAQYISPSGDDIPIKSKGYLLKT